ncbi:hypothetical protein HOU02_gp522 [Caulobacter phage CcrBL9]|uniref:Glycosyltransferase family 9 protein n=1 Tax=Caulobacter phage CcrBL9 TaxID=2283270 RepID=A0A385EBN7_9CAUD|nr:hypothetical protein HOU02_gp522 [Caulobacter phage CcrBL9]AXQ69203.1 hypothetical protein CcrBL9_gp179 [Caulobacter phage CcrBL9]
MGIGDKMMAIGDAWKLHQEDPLKRKVAIGDGQIVDPTDNDLLWGLDFVARAGQTNKDTPWVISHPGTRPYIDYRAMRRELIRQGRRPFKHKKLAAMLGKFIWNMDYRPTPAPIRLTTDEEMIVARWAKEPFVAIEPYIKASAPVAKQWPIEYMTETVKRLRKEGIKVVQISAGGQPIIPGAVMAATRSYREALAVLKAASLYVGPEGGLHHGSAAMGTKAVVMFGGYISPLTTGYDFHVNLTGGAYEPCGHRDGVCPHCVEAMAQITPDLVIDHSLRLLRETVTA